MRTNNKALILLLIAILAISGMASGVFAAGGHDGDAKPTLKITKFRPKEATEYAWEIGGSFGDWVDQGDGTHETMMNLTVVRERVSDELILWVEADLSLGASETLIVELGYDEEPVVEPDPEEPETIEAAASGSGEGSGDNSGDGSDNESDSTWVMLRRFEDITYKRVPTDSTHIEFEFRCEDLEHAFFDEIEKFKLIVPYMKSRGNTGYVTAAKELGLEEHETYGFAEIQSNFQEVLETANTVEGVTVACDTTKTNWLLDFDVLPLGEGDEILLQTAVVTDQPDELEGDLIQFQAYPYSESNEVFTVREEPLLAVFDLSFPAFGEMYMPSGDTSLSSLMVDGENILEPDDVDPSVDKMEYAIELPVGTVGFPTVSATRTDILATVAIVQATYDARSALVMVTAENGDVANYRIVFTFAGNNVATLSNLTLDGTTIDGFDPMQVAYRVNTTEGESMAAVDGTPTDPDATIDLDSKDHSLGETGFPITQYLVVTAEDQTTMLTYSVLFAPEGWLPEDEEEGGGNAGGNGQQGDKSDLQLIAVDNVVLDEFAPEILSYDVLLGEGTRSLPEVTAVAIDAEAVVEHVKPTRLPGQYKIKVKGSDDTEKTYTLEMDVEGLADGEFIELGAQPLPTEMMGLWLPPTADDFLLTRTSTQIRFWTSMSLVAPKLLIFEDVGDQMMNQLQSGDLKPLVTITTSQLKANGGNGKHSRITVDNGDGGYYKYNLKGRNLPNLDVGVSYVLILFNGDNMVEFQTDQPAMLHFVMGDQVKGSVDHRNRTLNIDGRNSNTGTNQ
jgi:hypothetical protein